MLPTNRSNYGLSLFEDSLLRELFNSPLLKIDEQVHWMRTDILEKNGHFIIEIEMPGFKKEDIKVSVEKGYLMVEAKVESHTEETDSKGVYYRKERCRATECSRSFYVGDVKEDSITAAYVNGILILSYPSENENETKESKRNIEIV